MMDPAAEAAGAAEYEAPDLEPSPEPVHEDWQLTRDDWQRTEQFMNTVGPFVGALANEIAQARAMAAEQQAQQQMAYGQQQQQPAGPAFDPFEPETVQQYIDQQIQQGTQMALAQALGPYEGMMQTVASEKGEQLANVELQRMESEMGPFNHDVAIMLAAPLIQAGSEPVQALRACAGFASRFEAEVRQSERQRMTGQMGQLRGGPENSSFSVGAAEEAERVPTGKGRYEEAVRRVLARRHPVNPLT